MCGFVWCGVCLCLCVLCDVMCYVHVVWCVAVRSMVVSVHVCVVWCVAVRLLVCMCAHARACVCDQIEKNEMGGACSTYGERRGVYRVLVGGPQGKRPFGRPRCRWEDNIEMGLQEVGFGLWTESSWLRIRTGGGQL